MANLMLTTIDNPFNPHKQFDEWFAFDWQKGYCSCAYLARLTTTSDSLSDEENEQIILQAMEDIVTYDPLGIYMMIGPDDEPHPVPIETVGGV